MKEWTGEARTQDEAIQRGLAKLGLRRDEVHIHPLGERSSGLLSLFGFHRVKVRLVEKQPAARPDPRRADRRYEVSDDRRRPRREREARGRPAERAGRGDDRRDSPRRADPPRRAEPRRGESRRETPRPEEPNHRRGNDRPRPDHRPAEPARGRAESKPRSPAPRNDGAFRPFIPPESLLAQWKDLLAWEDLIWDIQPVQNNRLPVILKTSRGERLAGHGGRALEALEYLFNLCSSGGDREKPWVSFRVDGFPSTDEQRAVDQALFAAFQVRRTGQPFRLDPMTAAQRRVVHQTLTNHPDVETSSEGEGAFRKVVVTPRAKGSAPEAPSHN